MNEAADALIINQSLYPQCTNPGVGHFFPGHVPPDVSPLVGGIPDFSLPGFCDTRTFPLLFLYC